MISMNFTKENAERPCKTDLHISNLSEEDFDRLAKTQWIRFPNLLLFNEEEDIIDKFYEKYSRERKHKVKPPVCKFCKHEIDPTEIYSDWFYCIICRKELTLPKPYMECKYENKKI